MPSDAVSAPAAVNAYAAVDDPQEKLIGGLFALFGPSGRQTGVHVQSSEE